jgi:uncharacterized C2H2 Zn-finger protein
VDSKHGGRLCRSASERESSDDLFIKCPYCKYFCGYDFLVKLHVLRDHYAESDRGNLAFACDLCGAAFGARIRLLVHKANDGCNGKYVEERRDEEARNFKYVEEKEYRCEECGEVTRTKKDYVAHYAANHRLPRSTHDDNLGTISK